ncbi:hypothetical protein V6N13_041617 [Hibiscus sabdariffa]
MQDLTEDGGGGVHWRSNSSYDGVDSSQSQMRNVIALLETRISGKKANKVIQSHGFTHSYRVEATRFSVGIWIMWRDNVSIDIIVVLNQSIHVVCVGKCNLLWDLLESLDPGDMCLWLLGGDFNTTFSTSERMGGSIRRDGVCRKFDEFIARAQLNDPRFQVSPFTWKRSTVHQCLNRCLGNVEWCNTWPHSFVQHLARLGWAMGFEYATEGASGGMYYSYYGHNISLPLFWGESNRVKGESKAGFYALFYLLENPFFGLHSELWRRPNLVLFDYEFVKKEEAESAIIGYVQLLKDADQ